MLPLIGPAVNGVGTARCRMGRRKCYGTARKYRKPQLLGFSRAGLTPPPHSGVFSKPQKRPAGGTPLPPSWGFWEAGIPFCGTKNAQSQHYFPKFRPLRGIFSIFGPCGANECRIFQFLESGLFSASGVFSKPQKRPAGRTPSLLGFFQKTPENPRFRRRNPPPPNPRS